MSYLKPDHCYVEITPKGTSQKILKELFTAFPDVVGKIGLYRGCGFVSGGTICLWRRKGQFTLQEGANPTLGQVGESSFVEEERVEIIVNDNEDKTELRKVVQKLKQVHEYEEVAYHVFRLEEGI
ncbi:hypothetical protein Clacol_002402 [Clathrus columnatus]|uniref:ATP phosphoribosyltransferase n=1 Tax=Clathrus columnatus TaxID=1419009 RepID=A0AAV5A4P5_9AGAM|nr:hypothetical protein Clacol_002402 [Clathrus columnatus]